MRKLTLALSTAALAVSGAAFAQTAPAQPRAAKPDMTRAQAQARAEAMFGRMDANRDGTFNDADRAATKARAFDRIDTDRNGSLSRAEFEAMQGTRAGRMGGKMAGQMAGKGHRMGGRGMAMEGPVSRQAFVDRALAMFDRADANRDGTVTQAERKAARDTMRQQWQGQRPARRQG